MDLKRYEEAVAAYDDALALDPMNAAAWYSTGNALGALGRYEEALQSFEESIRIFPKSPSPWYSKYMALRSLGRAQEAHEAWSTYKDLTYAHISFSENSGQSIEDAIIIMNATGEEDGVGSEYYYLEKRFGDAVRWGQISQSLVEDEEGRSYDVLEVPLTSGETVTIYFDITDFYGKGLCLLALLKSIPLLCGCLEMSEEGTEAAAATAVGVSKGIGVFEERAVFRADHPFIFMITDD